MRQQVPTWLAVVVVAAVIVVVALVYVLASRPRGGGLPEGTSTLPPQPGQVKEGSPYGKPIPPGAPPFLKQRGGQ